MKLRYLSHSAWLLATCLVHAGTPPLETLTHARQVVLRYGNTCAVKDDGTVWCWGSNWGANTNYAVPIEGITGAIALAAGGSHTCALLNNGVVQCWGSNGYGELGRDGIGNSSSVPVFVHGAVYSGEDHLSGVVSIAAGNQHTCAQLNNGRVVCWGKNNYGQLCNGTTNMSYWPVYATLPYGVTGIAAGSEHSCAILETNTLQCWGHNEHGQLGDGGYEPFSLPVPVKLAMGDIPVRVASSDDDDTCAVLSNRSLKCWGRNAYGELGNGSDDRTGYLPHSTPDAVVISTSPKQPLYPVADVAIGYIHACAKMDDGLGNTGAQCWGDNRWGQLGDGGSEDHSDLPTAVLVNGNASTPLSGVVNVAASGFSTCAVLSDETVQCWGDNTYGQLGTGFLGDLSFPMPLFPVKQAVDEIFKDGFN